MDNDEEILLDMDDTADPSWVKQIISIHHAERASHDEQAESASALIVMVQTVMMLDRNNSGSLGADELQYTIMAFA